MTAPLTCRTDVATGAPGRYAEQLVSHLTLPAEAPDAEALGRVQSVLGSHLERFGARDELVVAWAVGEGG